MESTRVEKQRTTGKVNLVVQHFLHPLPMVCKNGNEQDGKTAAESNEPAGRSTCPMCLFGALPDDIVKQILSFSSPKARRYQWEWIDRMSLVSRQFKQVARSLAPSKMKLIEFYNYQSSYTKHPPCDLRSAILTALVTSEWKRLYLREFHISYDSILELELSGLGRSNSDNTVPEILAGLKCLLSTPNALPKLTWLDVHTMDNWNYNLIDSEVFQALPFAVPMVTKLCLVGCFAEDSNDAITPLQLERFARSFLLPLESLSLGCLYWMSDEHMAMLLPVIGGQLTRLELFHCSTIVNDEYGSDIQILLSDTTMKAISQFCQRLETFAVVDSYITPDGVQQVLGTNNEIRSLDLSVNPCLNQDVALVIASHAPFLESLRIYDHPWFTDQAIKTIVDSRLGVPEKQEKRLQRIGAIGGPNNFDLTEQGLSYALDKGLQEIGIVTGRSLRFDTASRLADKYKHATIVVDTSWAQIVSGSLYVSWK